MDHAAFHVVYVDKRVSASLDGQYLHDVTRHLPAEKDSALPADQQSHCFQQISLENAVVRDNLGILVSSFNGGMSNGPVALGLIWFARKI